MSVIVCKPKLRERIAAMESRTEAFAVRHFGERPHECAGAAVELLVPGVLHDENALAFEVLLDLLLRMEHVVAEVRITADDGRVGRIISAAGERIPLEVAGRLDSSLVPVPFGIGRTQGPFLDVNDWCVGFSEVVASGLTTFIAGPFLGALEASKYIFLRAAEIAYSMEIDGGRWPAGAVFNAWDWRWNAPDGRSARSFPIALPELALVGCGGVGAAYLWFLGKSGLAGRLLLIDDDSIFWHNMNRLPYASVTDADAGRPKVAAAADFMRSVGWDVRTLERRAEHPQAMTALEACAHGEGLVASAVGEPETRRFLARRGFRRFFDAATNTDGSAQVLALHHGISSCIDCHVRARPQAPDPGGCGTSTTSSFAGVVPHLAAYAGVLLGLEQIRAVLEPATALTGANTQSIMRGIDEAGRVRTECCQSCPHQAT
jgi:molybdopterin/thiamine biosynthesis adenylyltransferase